MPPDVSGPGRAVGGSPIPPTAPVRPVSPSRALVPVEKVGPRSLPPTGSPLDRSGVALEDLLFAPDLLETRQAVAPVALEMGLESARGQLLRQLPGQALVALDAIWDGAQTTEEGWYLRSGALTVLGHPAEGERIATAGLEVQPASLALRMLQSVARAVVGDLSGARAALVPALQRAPNDPVLTAQQAVLLGRQGHLDDATALLDELGEAVPEHPALAWALANVRSARADRLRSARWSEPLQEPLVRTPYDDDVEVASASVADMDDQGDMVSAAFVRLGARLAVSTDAELIAATRTLRRACSTGGALAAACLPEEAHAGRQVLTALLVELQQDTAVPSPLGTIMRQLLPLLRSTPPQDATGVSAGIHSASATGLNDAVRLLNRSGASVAVPVRRMIELLLEGAWQAPPAGTAPRPSTTFTGEFAVLSPMEKDAGPLLPVRLGLSLLAEDAASRAIERSQVLEERPLTPVRVERVGGERAGGGWGAASAANETMGGDRRASRAGEMGASLPVVLCVAGAVGAAMNGAALVAGLLGAGAALLVLRRGRSTND